MGEGKERIARGGGIEKLQGLHAGPRGGKEIHNLQAQEGTAQVKQEAQRWRKQIKGQRLRRVERSCVDSAGSSLAEVRNFQEGAESGNYGAEGVYATMTTISIRGD